MKKFQESFFSLSCSVNLDLSTQIYADDAYVFFEVDNPEQTNLAAEKRMQKNSGMTEKSLECW